MIGYSFDSDPTPMVRSWNHINCLHFITGIQLRLRLNRDCSIRIRALTKTASSRSDFSRKAANAILHVDTLRFSDTGLGYRDQTGSAGGKIDFFPAQGSARFLVYNIILMRMHTEGCVLALHPASQPCKDNHHI